MHFIGSWLTCSIINHLNGYSATICSAFCVYIYYFDWPNGLAYISGSPAGQLRSPAFGK